MKNSEIKSRALSELRNTHGILDFGVIKVDVSKGTILLYQLFSHSPIPENEYDMVEIVEREIKRNSLYVLGDRISTVIGKHP